MLTALLALVFNVAAVVVRLFVCLILITGITSSGA